MYDMEGYFWRDEYHSLYNIRWLGYLDLACVAIASIFNALVIIVFSTKMISPINTIFIHIAITESLTLFTYLPRIWQELIRATLCSIPQHKTYIWETISINSYLLSFMLRTTTVWLALMLAVWRYIAIMHPFKETRWCNSEITRKFIILGYIFGALLSIPVYFCVDAGPSYKLVDGKGCITSNLTAGKNITIYEFQFPLENYPRLFAIAFAFYGVIIKLLPSIAFVFFNYRMMNYLAKMKKQHKTIVIRQLSKKAERTTKILLFMSLLFMIGEVPHGIFAVFCVYHGPKFFWKYYYYGMEINNSVTGITVCFNFIILYLMSDKFRETFNNMAKKIKNNQTDFSPTIPSCSPRFVSCPFDQGIM